MLNYDEKCPICAGPLEIGTNWRLDGAFELIPGCNKCFMCFRNPVLGWEILKPPVCEICGAKATKKILDMWEIPNWKTGYWEYEIAGYHSRCDAHPTESKTLYFGGA